MSWLDIMREEEERRALQDPNYGAPAGLAGRARQAMTRHGTEDGEQMRDYFSMEGNKIPRRDKWGDDEPVRFRPTVIDNRSSIEELHRKVLELGGNGGDFTTGKHGSWYGCGPTTYGVSFSSAEEMARFFFEMGADKHMGFWHGAKYTVHSEKSITVTFETSGDLAFLKRLRDDGQL